jgi:hypothetical protein
MVVHRSADKPFADVNPLGVVVRSVRPLDPGASFALHSGFLYRLDDGEPRIQHLAFHLELEDEPAAAPYLWADVGLDEGNSRVVARGAWSYASGYTLRSRLRRKLLRRSNPRVHTGRGWQRVDVRHLCQGGPQAARL